MIKLAYLLNLEKEGNVVNKKTSTIRNIELKNIREFSNFL